MVLSPSALLEGIASGAPLPQRRAMSKAITLLESTRADHRAQGDELLTQLLPHTGKAFRLGISGVPGVGKSTFIEALGLFLMDRAGQTPPVATEALDRGGSQHGSVGAQHGEAAVQETKAEQPRCSFTQRPFSFRKRVASLDRAGSGPGFP